jgi:hypothetical protein
MSKKSTIQQQQVQTPPNLTTGLLQKSSSASNSKPNFTYSEEIQELKNMQTQIQQQLNEMHSMLKSRFGVETGGQEPSGSLEEQKQPTTNEHQIPKL